MKMYMIFDCHLVVANSEQEAIQHFKTDSGIEGIPMDSDIYQLDKEYMESNTIHDDDSREDLTCQQYLEKSKVPHYVCDIEA